MGIVMDGKHAVTHYKVLKRLKKGFTYIECQLETGRTHQIRVHMASIKHPLTKEVKVYTGRAVSSCEGPWIRTSKNWRIYGV